MTTATLNCRNRSKLKSDLETGIYDIVIIGGGITGAGVARDAVLRGLSVALIEAQDFASGTSSRSSKMIHGGLRYLIQGDIPVVKESASERATLHRIAPHLAKRSSYVLTAKSLKEELALRAALLVYEKLGKVAKIDHHERWSLSHLQQEEPRLDTTGVRSAIVYPEYLTDDARLTLANVRDAVAHGAVAANYWRAEKLEKKSGIFSVSVSSMLPGDAHSATVRAKAVLNAAGPWVDAVCNLESKSYRPKLALSRGVHVVVPHATLPVNNTVVMSTPDKRKTFAVPNGRFTYIGTTDEFYPHSDYWPEVKRSDIDYLFDTTTKYFPSCLLMQDDIVSVWSGVRPLVGSTDQKATEISRKDEMWYGDLGVLSIGGGKLSAYRAMAERVVNKLVQDNGFNASGCQTSERPLPGGEPHPNNGATDTQSERWRSLYGSEAEIVSSYGEGLAAEVQFAVEHEGAVRLEDYWVRRSSRAWFDDNAGLDTLEPAAAIMGDLLSWSESRQKEEINHCLRIDALSRAGL